MNRNDAHFRSAQRGKPASATARVAARSADKDRACRWAIVSAFAIFLLALLARLGG